MMKDINSTNNLVKILKVEKVGTNTWVIIDINILINKFLNVNSYLNRGTSCRSYIDTVWNCLFKIFYIGVIIYLHLVIDTDGGDMNIRQDTLNVPSTGVVRTNYIKIFVKISLTSGVNLNSRVDSVERSVNGNIVHWVWKVRIKVLLINRSK